MFLQLEDVEKRELDKTIRTLSLKIRCSEKEKPATKKSMYKGERAFNELYVRYVKRIMELQRWMF